MNVKFRFGTEVQLPQSADDGELLFTDTGKLYRGSGTGVPLVNFGSVLSGFTNLTDLQTKNPAITDKLYLTADARLYSYSTGSYSLVSGASEVNGSDVVFNKLNSTLTSTNVNSAIIELDEKVERDSERLINLNTNLSSINGEVANINTELTNLSTEFNELNNNVANITLINDNTKSVGEFVISQSYNQNNLVLNDGSTWIALQDTSNNALPILPLVENENWRLIARKGADGADGSGGGAGSVVSVNGILPDGNGNIEIENLVQIEDNLTSTSANSALSANQGKVLKDNNDVLQGVVNAHISNTNVAAHTIDNIVGLREALDEGRVEIRLANVTDLNAMDEVITWVNSTSNDFVGVEVYLSESDSTSWSNEYCKANATLLVKGNVATTTYNYTVGVRYYIKVFSEYNVFGITNLSEGIVISKMNSENRYYTEGDEHEVITGGWVEGVRYISQYGGNGSQVKNANNLQLQISQNAGDSSYISYITRNKLDMADLNEIEIDVNFTANGSSQALRFSVVDNINDSYTTYVASTNVSTTGRQVLKIDVSNLSSSYYIRLLTLANNTVSSTTNIYNVKGVIN